MSVGESTSPLLADEPPAEVTVVLPLEPPRLTPRGSRALLRDSVGRQRRPRPDPRHDKGDPK